MGNEIIETPGLGEKPKKDWPKVSAVDEQALPIDRLAPGTELHKRVLTYLTDRLEMSEEEMKNFYARWKVQEQKIQAYISLKDWEQTLKDLNDKAEAPKAISVIIPYSFATISTIVTYLVHTFMGRKPMFQVSSYKKESIAAAEKMEQVIQYNTDHTRMIRHLFQFLQDGETYGLGILRTQWKNETKMRTVWKTNKLFGMFNMDLGQKSQKFREEKLVYSGNDVQAIDPFMFFPDPRVPMVEVNRKGEFVFWRNYVGKHTQKLAEANGLLKWVDHSGTMPLNANASEESGRALLSGGRAHPGADFAQISPKTKNYIQEDTGVVQIIPAELGLGTSQKPEKWIFTINNKKQIVQAERYDADHDMFPVVVIEPYTLGYGFGHPGISDYLAPIQDTLSWLVNSHISNVRTALNNMFVVDPSMVEMQDLKNPGPGKLIRLKKAVWGRDVRTALNQLAVTDVTGSHFKDFELFARMGDSLSAVNDNLRGIQDPGGRKTATEVRTSGEAAASRLAAHARLISAQGMVDLAEQMSVNIQQNLDEEFYLNIVGQEGLDVPIHSLEGDSGVGTPTRISPEMLTGDFYFPVHDGTLPLDRVAMLDVWKEILLGVAQDQELRLQFSLPKIFEYVAELGGAKNIDQFKVDVQAVPDAGLEAAAASGNAVPIGGQTPGVEANPGNRIIS